MAFFNVREWIDRISQHPNRRTLTNVEDPTDVKTYDISRAEGTVTTQGTAITGANLTDLENRIGSAFTAVENAMPEANPAETATASLTKLKVRGTVYDVEGTSVEKGTIQNVSIASFSDGADNVPVSELIVNITATQAGSGTPSPSNPRSISGWSSVNVVVDGINQWDEEWEVGSISDSDGSNASDNSKIRSKNYTPIKPSTDYFIVCPSTSKNGKAFFYDKNKTLISSVWFYGNAITTSPSNAYYIRFRLVNAYGTTYNNDISINYPSTDTDYHAFNGGTYTISLGDTYYGGTLNVTTGLLTIDKQIVDLGALNWSTAGTGDGQIFTTTLSDSKEYSTSDTPNAICENYKPVSWTYMSNNPTVEKIFSMAYSQKYLAIKDQTYTDAATFKTAMSGVQLVYELATPTEITLTPTEVRTLLEDNNIFADTGDVNKLVYFKTGCESITDIINVMHDDSKMSYGNAYGKKTCNQLTDPGIYYNIDTTGSPAEGYSMTTLITTYNCQILVYLGLVVNTRRVNHAPGGTITFSPWKRLANEDDLDGIEKITKAEWDAMTAEEREAFIGVVEDTNADYVPLTADNIPYDSENSIAEKVETIPTYSSQMPLSPTDDTTVGEAIDEKADKATSLGGYGITDAYTKTEINNTLANYLTNAIYKSSTLGSFAGLVTNNSTWLFVAQRLSTRDTYVCVLNRYNNNYLIKDIVKDPSMTIATNDQGTVSFSYGGSTAGVHVMALKIAQA